MQSEPVPERNDGPVVKVVGQTFEKIVMDSTVDVVIAYVDPKNKIC
jgi:hypothetical protein